MFFKWMLSNIQYLVEQGSNMDDIQYGNVFNYELIRAIYYE